jgi:hypothetical protein
MNRLIVAGVINLLQTIAVRSTATVRSFRFQPTALGRNRESGKNGNSKLFLRDDAQILTLKWP